MIRKLMEKDREAVLTFLREEPLLNLFQIGDIRNYGFNSSIQTVYGYFDTNHQLTGVLLRYRQHYLPYFKEEGEVCQSFLDVIKTDPEAQMISGDERLVRPFYRCFNEVEKEMTFLCELIDGTHLPSNELVGVKRATVADAPRIATLIQMIAEFHSDSANVQNIRQKIKDESGRIYYIENEHKEVISVAQSTAENEESAMIVGVATHPLYRRRGFMTQTLSKLCYDLLAEQKRVCLFYDNEAAGRIYHRLGFKTMGTWVMLRRVQQTR